MTNRNINQHGAQKTGWGVMIGRCSLDSQHRRPVGILRMLAVLLPGTQMFLSQVHKRRTNLPSQQRRKGTREDNKLTIYCYFRSNPAKIGYRKRMIEIWTEIGRFKVTNQRLESKTRRKNIPMAWINVKRFYDTSIHDRLELERNKCLQRAQVAEWMTKGRTTLIQKDPSKGSVLNNYRLITCLPMMWKILTAQVREEIYYSQTSRGLFLEKQKRCCKESKGTAMLLLIDQHILNESKTRLKKSNYGLDWLQKGMWYGSVKLDNKLPQIVQNITWSPKLYRKNHEKMQS